MRSPLVALTVLTAAALASPAASAQQRPAQRPGPPGQRPAAGAPQAGGPSARQIPLRQAVQMLQSADNDEVLLGVEALTLIGTAEVVGPLVELVHRGLPDGTLETVVEKLGIIGRPEAIDELSSLLHHRRPAVRAEAVKALKSIRDGRVRALLESALRDSDGEVRASAARALGETNARQSVELLQRAFERNVPAAAESIGRLGDVAAANRLLEAVGRAPLDVLLPGFLHFLNRADIPDPEKLRIIEQIVSRSPTGQVRSWLERWVERLPPANRSRSRARAELAIRQIQPGATAPSAPPPAAPAPQGGAR